MSNQYGDKDTIPNEVLVNRLHELSTAVTQGRDAVQREFTMRIPAERDRDADLVLSEAARRLHALAEREAQEHQCRTAPEFNIVGTWSPDNQLYGLHIQFDMETGTSIKLDPAQMECLQAHINELLEDCPHENDWGGNLHIEQRHDVVEDSGNSGGGQ